MKRAAVVALALALFALLAYGVLTEGPLTAVDREVLLFMVAHRSTSLTSAMMAVSAAHQTLAVLAATALVAGVLAWRKYAHRPLLLWAIPSGMLANDGLKHLFGRARPALDDPLLRLTTLSFPSGHAIAATLFYGALLLLLLAHAHQRPVRMAAAAFAVFIVALVSFSRVYLGVHYLSDVLAAICFGVAWLALWLDGLDRWQRRRPR